MAGKAKEIMKEALPQVAQVMVNGFGDFPEVESHKWSFNRNGQVFSIPFKPLTYEQQEEIDSMFVVPAPPMKDITDEKEKLRRAASKMPLAEPDPEDPEYIKQKTVIEEKRSLARVWKAFGWAMTFEDFCKELKSRLTPAEMLDLVGFVSRVSYRVDPLRVESFF